MQVNQVINVTLSKYLPPGLCEILIRRVFLHSHHSYSTLKHFINTYKSSWKICVCSSSNANSLDISVNGHSNFLKMSIKIITIELLDRGQIPFLCARWNCVHKNRPCFS